MRALVVRQPRATLIALRQKTIETRPAPPSGPMRPDGVRGLPGCSLERGERIAIVAGASAPKYDDHGEWMVDRWASDVDRNGGPGWVIRRWRAVDSRGEN